MQKRSISHDLLDERLSSLLKKTASSKPEVTGGFVVLSTANLGLALVLLSLEISRSRTREHVKKLFLKAQISTLKQLQEVLSQAASYDLQIFNRFREIPGRTEKKLKAPSSFALFLETIESPLKASKRY